MLIRPRDRHLDAISTDLSRGRHTCIECAVDRGLIDTTLLIQPFQHFIQIKSSHKATADLQGAFNLIG